MNDFQSNDVHAVFNKYPVKYQKALLSIRELIFKVASSTHEIGTITETLKWGQPSYLAKVTNSGTTIRLDRFGDAHIAIFFHCQTTLIETFKTLFPELIYEKNRAIILDPEVKLPDETLSLCIKMALTYKLLKRGRS